MKGPDGGRGKGKGSFRRSWNDPDDGTMDEEGIKGRRTKLEPREGHLYQERLVQNFEMVYGPTPKWARLEEIKVPSQKMEDEDVDNMDFTEELRLLSLGKLDIVRVENLNSTRSEGAIIRSVDFHPDRPVGLVAGDSSVSLYQVNGNSNPLIQTIAFDDFPIRKAQFCCKGEEIYVSSGLMSHFYCYDMHSGKVRQVKPNQATKHETVRNILPCPDNKHIVVVGRETLYLLSKASKEIVHSWSVNGDVKGISFTPDGNELFVQDANGTVYRWKVKTRSCIEKFTAEANFDGTCLAASSKYIACGSSSGFVSIFENQHHQGSENDAVSSLYKQPLGEIKNLVNPISALKINCSEELLAMACVDKENAVRLVHLPTRKTFAGFPAPNANYGRCNSLAFSPNSGYFALGSNRGCAYLFRLKHFNSY